MSELCNRIKSILDDLWANPTIENVDKLAAQIGEAEFTNIIDHIEECPVCEQEFSGRLSTDSPKDEKEGNFMVAFLGLVAKFDKETEKERLAREEILKKLDEVERKDEETIYQFVEARSGQLDPELFYEIPMKRYRYIVFFLAADAIGMLLGRTARRKFKRDTRFRIAEDGTILHGKKVCFTGEQVQHEIARMIRDAQSESDELDLETAGKIARWVFWALAYGNWNIIPGYVGSMPGEEELSKRNVLVLTPTDQNNDPLDGWK